MSPTIAALVPMRHHSERVKQKNYRDFAGKPLFHHILETLQASEHITKIVVNTDSPVIKVGIGEHFPNVQVIDRPEALCAGTVPMNDILLYDTERVAADFYLQTHSTNPLLRTGTIDQAITRFLQQYPFYDSLFGVTRLQTRLWDQLARPINHNAAILLRTQDLPPVYEENSNIYIFTRDILAKCYNRIGERPLMFEIAPDEAWDIDEAIDFDIAEFFFLRRRQGGQP
jgi:CMP-N-acetylneuraminic acid synthetase